MRLEKKSIVILVIFILYVFVILLPAYFGLYTDMTYGYDAGIFAYIGMAINKGLSLYTGAWDNKGPLLYLINAAGVKLNYPHGIYYLEIISLFVFIAMSYKTIRMFYSKFISLVTVLICTSPLIYLFEGGNMVEEWALPFISIILFYFSKFLVQRNHINKGQLIIVGMCSGAIFLLRLNILAFICVIVLFVLTILIINKEYEETLKTITFGLIGFFVIILPVAVWLWHTDSFFECVKSAYIGVAGSFNSVSKVELMENISGMILSFNNSGILFLMILFLITFPMLFNTFCDKDTAIKILLIASYISVFVVLMANSISGAGYMHYAISFVPITIIPVAWMFNGILQAVCTLKRKKTEGRIIAIAFALLISMPCLPVLRANIIDNLRNGYGSENTNMVAAISDYVLKHSDEDDIVLLLGDNSTSSSYYRTKRLAASNHFYYASKSFTDEFKKEISNKIVYDIRKEKPQIIFFGDENTYNDFYSHIENKTIFNNFIEKNYIFDSSSVLPKDGSETNDYSIKYILNE